MKDGNNLNQMSINTEEGDDDDMFLAALAEATQIAASLIAKEEGAPKKTLSELIAASHSLKLISIENILK